MPPINTFLPDFILNFAAQLGASLAMGALGRIEQAVEADPVIASLQHAYATGIAAMIAAFPIHNEDEYRHYESLLQLYFEHELVKIELFKLIQPNQTPEVSVLLNHLQNAIYIPNISNFNPEEVIQALLQGFEAGAFDSEEFRSRLTLKQLAQIGHISTQQTHLLEAIADDMRRLSQQMMAVTFVASSIPQDQNQLTSDHIKIAPFIPRAIQPHLKYLREEINRGKVALFVGAGVSREAGLPSGWELAEILAQEIDYIPQPGDTLGTIAEYYDRELPGRLIERLVPWLCEGKLPGPSHKLIPHFNWSTIYTTNYDELLEQGYEVAKKSFEKVLYNQQLQDLPTNTTPIIKLHGCLSRAHRRSTEVPIVITDKNYEDYGPRREALINKLKQFLFEGNTLLFLGYSLKDPFWQDLRRDVASILQEHTRSYYAVIPYFTEQWSDYWRARQVRLIAGTAHIFLQQLLTLDT
jgi:hypothetical protein